MDRLLIAGTNSGCGKTTVTLSILAALQKRGMNISSFKCGPDYIDPMFHCKVMGVFSHNLDPFFCEEEMLRQIFITYAGGQMSVIEGVMGYYDGIGPSVRASTFDVAEALRTPVVLVMNARGMAASAGAVLAGFLRFRESSLIRGVIFNGLTEAMYPIMAEIASSAGVTPFGFLPHLAELSLESRHLGLVTANEVKNIRDKIRALGALAEEYIDIGGLVSLAGSAPIIKAEALSKWSGVPRVRIAVSRDRAFCFIYQENIELLKASGCEIAYFSPLTDKQLPEDISGLYLCGGYPELHATQLSGNVSMRRSIKEHIDAGLPTIAECGGFMYLHKELDGLPMVGVIPGSAYKTERLQRFGYLTLEAELDNLLSKRGDRIRAHEFHYYDSTDCGGAFTAIKASTFSRYSCIHASDSLYAGFPHLYFPANPAFAESFVRKAIQYDKNH